MNRFPNGIYPDGLQKFQMTLKLSELSENFSDDVETCRMVWNFKSFGRSGNFHFPHAVPANSYTLIRRLIIFSLTPWEKMKFKVYNCFNEKIKLFLLETGFSWSSFSVLPGMRNVDSCTLPSWCRSICFVLVTINTFLGLLSTILWRHLTHSKTMAQACSSVIGALKHNCQSHLH